VRKKTSGFHSPDLSLQAESQLQAEGFYPLRDIPEFLKAVDAQSPISMKKREKPSSKKVLSNQSNALTQASSKLSLLSYFKPRSKRNLVVKQVDEQMLFE